jgi:hypothetical protein
MERAFGPDEQGIGAGAQTVGSDELTIGAGEQTVGAASSAPKGQPIPGQGNALGSTPLKNSSPEGAAYLPFQGICLTDTFQLYEKGDLISNLLVNNSGRRIRQKALDIRVIMGNPPYSVGQTNATIEK